MSENKEGMSQDKKLIEIHEPAHSEIDLRLEFLKGFVQIVWGLGY